MYYKVVSANCTVPFRRIENPQQNLCHWLQAQKFDDDVRSCLAMQHDGKEHHSLNFITSFFSGTRRKREDQL
jgi:hypothetical protein